MQSMAAAFGASIVRAPTLVHGEAAEVTHDGAGPARGHAAVLHGRSLPLARLDPATLPPELRVTAMSEVDRVVMGIRHVALPLEGVQFHPESVLTPEGPHLLANFLRQAGEGEASRLDAATGSFATAGMAETDRGGGAMSDEVRAALATIVEGGTLVARRARGRAMGAVMDGEATPAQLAALLMALRMRGETVDELAGFATAMRERVVRVEAPEGAIDIVGTGGDGSGTFNISTTAALVVAAAGVPVAKHGNRAITSRAGSADVLEALGIRIDHDAASAGEALREIGFAFLFAPDFHPAMKHAGPDPSRDRRPNGIQPARAADQPGRRAAPAPRASATRRWPRRMAEVLRRLGTERTFVVHGDGVDELPLDGSGVAYIVAGDASSGIRSMPPRSASSASRRRAWPAVAATRTPGCPRRSSAASRAPPRRRPPQRGCRAARGRRRRARWRRGSSGPPLTIDAGLAIELLERLRAERRAAEAARAQEAGAPA